MRRFPVAWPGWIETRIVIDDQGKRKEFPLGTDLNEAKRKWAEFECKLTPTDATPMQFVFEKNVRDIVPAKAPATQLENERLPTPAPRGVRLRPIDAISPEDIARYREARSAKLRANREITLLSHPSNMASE